MKRLITAAAAAVLLISPAVVSAQEHMLEVKRYSDYAKDYLTITDAGLPWFICNRAYVCCKWVLVSMARTGCDQNQRTEYEGDVGGGVLCSIGRQS